MWESLFDFLFVFILYELKFEDLREGLRGSIVEKVGVYIDCGKFDSFIRG